MRLKEKYSVMIRETPPDNPAAVKKILEKIYQEQLLDFDKTLPTLIFSECHGDPATSRVIAKLSQRLVENGHSFTFYDEFPGNQYRDRYLSLAKEEMITGIMPDEFKSATTSPESRKILVRLNQTLRRYQIPVEAIDHPDMTTLVKHYQENTSKEKQINLSMVNNLTYTETIKKTKIVTKRDKHMAEHYLSGHGVIGRIGLMHAEGIQKYMDTTFSSEFKNVKASSNYCFFYVYSNKSPIADTEIKRSHYPLGITEIDLSKISEEDAVELILQKAQATAKEMQKTGYRRLTHSPEKNFNNLERLCKSILEHKTEIKKIDFSEKIVISLFAKPEIYWQWIKEYFLINSDSKYCPENFKQFLLNEAAIGRFDILLAMKHPPADYYLNGESLLHAAIAAKNQAAVKLLLDNGAPLELKDADGLTPLKLAFKTHDPKIIGMLLHEISKYRDVFPDLVEAMGGPEKVRSKYSPALFGSGHTRPTSESQGEKTLSLN